jgi:hypothetical protein
MNAPKGQPVPSHLNLWRSRRRIGLQNQDRAWHIGKDMFGMRTTG